MPLNRRGQNQVQGGGARVAGAVAAAAGGAAVAGQAASGEVYCCVPSGCDRLKTAPIRPEAAGDAVRVLCNNEQCPESGWMHADCFSAWEEQVLAYLRSCGRARSWSEKQRLQNLWTKKGYDLAYKACDCRCTRGHLRKDLNYYPKQSQGEDMTAKRNKKQRKKHDKQLPTLQKTPAVTSHAAPSANIARENPVNNLNNPRHQLRVRTSSFSSTGSSPPSSAGTPPSGGSGKQTKFAFFADLEQAAAGNIFKRRDDLSAFSVLPRHHQNPYHIQLEDEGPHGNDETRCFVLSNLSSRQVTHMRCVLCSVDLPVYDRYPLIDGTFFLSPLIGGVQVLADHRTLYLHAACLRCLAGIRQIKCRACRKPWQGKALVLGSMYSYDIFAAQPCCAHRLTCKCCKNTILDPSSPLQFYSDYSRPIQCPHCQAEDCHFVKPLDQCYTICK